MATVRYKRIPLYQRFQFPPTLEQISEAIRYQWECKYASMEWGEMEELLSHVLNAPGLTDFQKVGLTMECIDAYTRRGHFSRDKYPSNYEDTRGLL